MLPETIGSGISMTTSGESRAATFSCMLCRGKNGALVVGECRDLYLGKPYVVDYFRCTDCGLAQQHPVPDDVAPYYGAYPIHAAKSRLYSALRRQLMSGVYLPPAKWPNGTKLLDFGCGDGWYLEWCHENGIACIGFEADPKHAAALGKRLGIPVLSDMKELTASYKESFDVITLHFVVEHLTDIRQILSQVVGLLRPGGIIRYVVPNIDSWEFRIFGKSWHSLDAPRHISFPNARHAKQLAEELGLAYDGEESVAFPNGFGGSIPTFLFGKFGQGLLIATLPFSLIITKLFPSGNRAYRLSRRS